MKKIIGIALVLALIVTLGFSSIALADGDGIDADIDSSDDAGLGGEINVTWDGTGWVGGYVSSGDDAETWFYTEADGSHIKGSFTASKTVNTAYPYMGVDTYSCYLNAEVEADSWAEIEFWTDRTDSYVSYGPAGQSSYNYLGVEDGSGAMAMGSWTNFACQKDCCYKKGRTENGHHFEVDGAEYYIERYISSYNGGAGLMAYGENGSAWLDCMNSQTWGGSATLGRGCGCYTDADFHAEGDYGYFEAGGMGDNGVTLLATGDTAYTSGSYASLGIIAEFTNGGVDIGDYSVYAW